MTKCTKHDKHMHTMHRPSCGWMYQANTFVIAAIAADDLWDTHVMLLLVVSFFSIFKAIIVEDFVVRKRGEKSEDIAMAWCCRPAGNCTHIFRWRCKKVHIIVCQIAVRYGRMVPAHFLQFAWIIIISTVIGVVVVVVVVAIKQEQRVISLRQQLLNKPNGKNQNVTLDFHTKQNPRHISFCLWCSVRTGRKCHLEHLNSNNFLCVCRNVTNEKKTPNPHSFFSPIILGIE